jgi:hypothetical protein
MNKFRTTINILAVLVFTLAFASLAQAQATRTWVSGVGDDVNPCSRTAPCKTFAGAISKTAPGGEIDALDPGGFGAITITKSITIDGTTGSGFASILSSGVNGVIVNANVSTDVVTLRNLSINGAGASSSQNGLSGIRYLAGKTVIVQNCSIFGFTQKGIDASGLTNNGELIVSNTNITNIAAEGIRAATTVGSVLVAVDNSRFEKCATGAFFGDRTRGTVADSYFTHNTNGLISNSAANDSQVNIDNCVFAYGGVGIQAGAGAVTLRVSDCTIVQNGTGINLAGGTATSFGNNAVLGNGGGESFTGAVVPLK